MYSRERYERDLRFVEKIEKIATQRIEFIAYFMPLAACVFAHTMYGIMFYAAEVWIMAVFNIFSVLFYILTIVVYRFVKEKVNLVYAAIAEIIVHATVATACVGWAPDFGMLLLMLIPIIFLMPNKKRWLPIAMMIMCLAIYASLRVIYWSRESTIYDIDHSMFATAFFWINMCIGSGVLIFVTTLYTFVNSYTGSKMRVQNEQLRIMASTDPLTKLNNRREMNRVLAETAQLSRQTGNSYVVGIGDIDFFKKVNDTYGHDHGDIVLSKVAEVIAASLPDKASASRWGGEEFLFVIPDCGIEEGAGYADNIVGTVRREVFTSEGIDFSVTMTIGICEAHPDDITDKVISCADSRLYKGKHNGRNHIEYTD